MMSRLFLRKSLDRLIVESENTTDSLKRTLGPVNLVTLGSGLSRATER